MQAVLLNFESKGVVMILGIGANAFTVLHVMLSLAGIASGLAVLFGLAVNRLYQNMCLFFLATTALTSLTGFAFPNSQITPAIVLGILSLIALVVAGAAIYFFHLKGRWRSAFVIGAIASLYFNLFVLVVQMFRHVPFFTHLDSTQSGPPFVIAQLALLATFIWVTVVAVKGFKVGSNA
jgi:hypothetical protein